MTESSSEAQATVGAVTTAVTIQQGRTVSTVKTTFIAGTSGCRASPVTATQQVSSPGSHPPPASHLSLAHLHCPVFLLPQAP